MTRHRSLLPPSWPRDLNGALLVTLLAIPQGLAYAALAGLPAEVGLYASCLPALAYVLTGGSRQLVVGPVALIGLMTASALEPWGQDPDLLGRAAWLTLLTAAWLLLFAVLRLGALAQLMSQPVVAGFIQGAALVILFNQWPTLTGQEGSASLSALRPDTLLAALLLILLLWGGRWLARRSGHGGLRTLLSLLPILAVVATTLLARLLDWQTPQVGQIPRQLLAWSWPGWHPDWIQPLLWPAFMIALVTFVESIAIVEDQSHRLRQDTAPNRELLGLGSANLVAGLCAPMPVAGSFVRTAVAEQAGVGSRLFGLASVALLAIGILVAAPWLGHLPQVTLGAIIFVSALGLLQPGLLRRLWHYDRTEALSFLGTLLGVVAFGVETGLMIGIGLSLAALVWQASRPHVAVLGRLPGTVLFRNVRHQRTETVPGILMLRIDENLFFGNVAPLQRQIRQQLVAHPQTRHLVLVMSSVSHIDSTALHWLERLQQELRERGTQLHFAEIKQVLMARLVTTPLFRDLAGSLFFSCDEALQALQQQNPAPATATDAP